MSNTVLNSATSSVTSTFNNKSYTPDNNARTISNSVPKSASIVTNASTVSNTSYQTNSTSTATTVNNKSYTPDNNARTISNSVSKSANTVTNASTVSNTPQQTNKSSDVTNTVPAAINNYDSYSSISDIYANYTEFDRFYNLLLDSSANINSDINKIRELLDDLNTNWKSTLSTSFTNSLQKYLLYFSDYSDFYRYMAKLLAQSKTAYKKFDEHFENEII